MTETGRALSKPRGDGFTALSWLENDGDAAEQPAAFARDGFAGQGGSLWIDLAGQSIVHLSGRGAEARVSDACRTASLVVIAREVEAPANCKLMTGRALRATGSLAVFPAPGALRIVSANDGDGRRPWSGQ
jgi:competence protein ComEC